MFSIEFYQVELYVSCQLSHLRITSIFGERSAFDMKHVNRQTERFVINNSAVHKVSFVVCNDWLACSSLI
jgi:hypothetical protein